MMTAFVPVEVDRIEVRLRMACMGRSEAEIKGYLKTLQGCYANNLYQVMMRKFHHPVFATDVVHLSIKRLDQRPIHDWRDLQYIKNMLVSPNCEGLELYPSEERLADSANQYHLWVFADENFRIPLGFDSGRFVKGPDEAAKTGAVQRPFPEKL